MDKRTKQLDGKILNFIKKYPEGPAPDTEFGKLALEIFEYQFNRNCFYRSLCVGEGKEPGHLISWKDIPAMPAVGFKELVLTTFPKENAVKVFQTSGTTRGSRGAHFFDALELYESAILPVFKNHLLPDDASCRFFFLTASPKDLIHSSLSHMMGVVNEHFSGPGKGKFYVKKDRLLFDEFVEDLRANRGRKSMILATAFSLKSVLDHLKLKKIRLKTAAGSRLMETGGFKGKSRAISRTKLYKECHERLGIDENFCVSEYGMTELSSQCYDTTLKDRVLRVRRKPFKEGPAWLRTIVIDPRTGREAKKRNRGLLRHFDLANRGSVMAVQTEDMGRAAGDGFELLGRAPVSELRGCSLSYEKFITA